MSNDEIRRNLGFGLPHGENKMADVKSSVRRVEQEEELSTIPEFLLRFMDIRGCPTASSFVELNRMQQEICNKFYAGHFARLITYYDGTVKPVEWREMYTQPEEENPINVMAITRQMCK